MRTLKTQLLRFAVGLVITIFFAFLVIRRVNLHELATAATSIHRTALIAGLVFLFVEYCLRAVRWWLMIRSYAPNIPIRASFWPIVVSVAINNVAPFRAGDALRVFGFREQLKAPPVHLLGTLIVERLLDMTILSAFLLAGSLNINREDALPLSGEILVALGSAVVVCWAVVLTTERWLRQLVVSVFSSRLLSSCGWRLAAEQRAVELLTSLGVVYEGSSDSSFLAPNP